MKQIPRVDISRIHTGLKEIPDEDLKAVGKLLNEAFSGYGFVYLLNHGVQTRWISDVFSASRTFFELPSEKKNRWEREPLTTQGWVRPGQEMLDMLKEEKGAKAIHELRETYDVVSLSQDSLFPDEVVPELRQSITLLGEHLMRLSKNIHAALAVSLGLSKVFFDESNSRMLQRGNLSKLRSLYYPPIHGNIAPGTTRCGEHSDYGTLTFLCQDSLGGLEVRGSDMEWIEATPVKDAILVNVGDLMEILTNGHFPATRHRVVVPEQELRRKQPRQSFVFFVHPNDDIFIQPIHGVTPKKEKYQGIQAGQHTLNQFAKTYQY